MKLMKLVRAAKRKEQDLGLRRSAVKVRKEWRKFSNAVYLTERSYVSVSGENMSVSLRVFED